MTIENHNKMILKELIVILGGIVASVVLIGIGVLNFKVSIQLGIKIVFIIIGIGLFYVSRVVFQKKKIYWITRHNYKQIVEMSENEKDEIVSRFYTNFSKCCIVLIIYSIIAAIIGTELFLDVVVYIVCLILGGIRA